ncbi:adenosylhomocysteinase, partial [Microbacterium schleiferi]|uniref:adenosylhomocysteinase n=1 Tax=Microbacterium schleiferi TaxID=69362 RepID=UPI0035C7A397
MRVYSCSTAGSGRKVAVAGAAAIVRAAYAACSSSMPSFVMSNSFTNQTLAQIE